MGTLNNELINNITKSEFANMLSENMDAAIKDIAHALSLNCLANGHIKHFHSIAQHSINCVREAESWGLPKKIQLACLLRNASKAYIQNIKIPNNKFSHEYVESEEELQNIIYNKFEINDLNESDNMLIKEIDYAVLYHELLNLMEGEIFNSKPEILSNPSFNQKHFDLVEKGFLSTYKKITGPIKSGVSIGIDGCEGKWIAVAIYDGGFDVGKYNTIEEICEKYENANSMIIDIPIGLPENKDDIRPDRIIKKYLGKKGSSIFETPCRQAIYANDKESARAENIRTLGKSLSSQSLSIGKAIRQVDQHLQNKSEWKNRLLESHPEYCFMILNNNEPVLTKKTEKEGQNARMNILNSYYPESQRVIDKFLSDVPSRSKIDDIIDAMCLAIIGTICLNNGFKTIPEHPMLDSKGIKMQMVIPEDYI